MFDEGVCIEWVKIKSRECDKVVGERSYASK
jgi:hypothetical protein